LILILRREPVLEVQAGKWDERTRLGADGITRIAQFPVTRVRREGKPERIPALRGRVGNCRSTAEVN
jgi:hypothetical protein